MELHAPSCSERPTNAYSMGVKTVVGTFEYNTRRGSAFGLRSECEAMRWWMWMIVRRRKREREKGRGYQVQASRQKLTSLDGGRSQLRSTESDVS